MTYRSVIDDGGSKKNQEKVGKRQYDINGKTALDKLYRPNEFSTKSNTEIGLSQNKTTKYPARANLTGTLLFG